MGIFGKKKELTPEQNREQMEAAGIQVNTGYKRDKKFNSFQDHAQKLASQKGQYVPGGSSSAPPSSNPYANAGAQLNYQPSSSAYGDASNRSTPPPSYRTTTSNNDYAPAPPPSDNPYASAEQSYATRFGQNNNLARTNTTDTYDRSRNELFKGAREQEAAQNGGGPGAGGLPGRSGMRNFSNSTPPPQAKAQQSAPADDEDELNYTPSELDAQNPPEEPEQEMDSEDEDVEAIKGQMRFVKQQSVNSTRNALRMASEAEESGRNTLGMLGSQGERLANTEHNLSLAETQNKLAEEKARELKTLNRSMFAVHVSNPFGKKKRLEEREERMRNEKRAEQYEREQRRQRAFDSQQRVSEGLTQKSDVAQRYKQRNYGDRAKYQFEADSEDEGVENEIDDNLDAISSATKRLHKLATTTSDEVTKQNKRLDNIADSTDTLDVNVHLNTNRLANIK